MRSDVVVIDGCVNVVDAVAAARRCAAETPAAVLILAPKTAGQSVLESLVAGARGCLPMASNNNEWASVIKIVHAGAAYIHPSFARFLVEDYVRLTRWKHEDPYDRLTEREKDVLRLVAEGRTGQQVAQQLGISPRTAEGHITRAMNKLDIHTRGMLIRYAIKKGLVEL